MTALQDIVVLDLGQIYNGPYATFLMAMAGARVIKVESLTGESLRGRGLTSSAAYPFEMLNQSKESVSLDLKHPDGKALFLDLVRQADVVLENFSPDTMERLGLGYEQLEKVNPGIIYAAGSGYGRSGPHRDYLAMDITVQAMSGLMSITGTEGGDPLKSGAAVCDFFGGVHLYGAIVTKLYERQRTGKGAMIDMAMQDAVLPTLASVFGAYYFNDRQLPPRTGNRHPALTMAPYNVYRARDGHVAVICVRDGHWRSLLTAIDREDLLARADLEKMMDRAAHMEEVDQVVGDWIAGQSRQDALTRLQAHGVPASVVRNIEEIMTDEHLHQRGTLNRVTHPVLGELVMMNSAINTATGAEVSPRPAPALGEHTHEVLRDLLGLNESQLNDLQDKGVTGQP
ncbi:MAG: CoA transferase [Pseudomonadales bacterium]|nr:CoA transferase [Pseudomonadales bacterium]